ncbi:carbohydrate binding domain-containing protein, partial [Lentisalinibacter salinarum]
GGGELLTNGDFEASAADKAPWVNAGGVVTNNFYTADALDGQQVFDTNLSQVAAIAQGTEYVLSFRARASVARDMIAGIGLSGAPFTAETATVPLTTEWQSYSYNLTAVADIGTAESRVLFDMGGVTSTVNIDDVSLT